MVTNGTASFLFFLCHRRFSFEPRFFAVYCLEEFVDNDLYLFCFKKSRCILVITRHRCLNILLSEIKVYCASGLCHPSPSSPYTAQAIWRSESTILYPYCDALSFILVVHQLYDHYGQGAPCAFSSNIHQSRITQVAHLCLLPRCYAEILAATSNIFFKSFWQINIEKVHVLEHLEAHQLQGVGLSSS